ncbi:DUF2207 domain-containing protein [Kaistella antarctica]|uniref:Predicted membrane protein (DUF2207) n=1 Tax=Kaistella antarctica TaxID=266748 RepID=A0A3S4ULU2_9FLAO|nr:DUF2207 domain-containing protein [Kaistella antarctica]SEW02886.1 Predicted membrane protein [Kaistella antarctica]VEH98860.1 Predicted membrane protein (DUF2207) [Kaistella antarctica]
MKRLLIGLFLLIFSFGFTQDVTSTGVENLSYEHILAFDSDIVISKDAETTITEKIKVYAEGNIIKRGIFRSLPLWRNINGKKIRIKYDIISVKKNGFKENYHTENTDSDYGIYFGNKEIILSPGVYEYELKYKTSDQIGFFDKYDEFYWNVNGTLWDFAVDQISAKVTLPEGAEIIQNSCYTGGYKSNESNCIGKQLSTNTIEWLAKNLGSNEGLTIAVGFNKGIFTPPPPPGMLEKYGVLGALLAAALGLLGYFFTSWQKYGVDPQKPIVYPQFNAPQNLSPASLGYLENEYYSEQMITAAIVSLAVKGFIKIIEDDKRVLGIFGSREYTLEKIREQDQTLPKEEINLMNKLFSGESNTISFDGKYNSKIEYAVNDFKASLKFQHDAFLSKGNNARKLILPIIIIAALYGLGLYFSYKVSYSDVHLGAGIPMIAAALFVGIFISIFFERSNVVKILFGLLSIGLIVIFVSIFSIDSNRSENLGFYASYGFLIFGFIGMVLFQYLIKQPTPQKLETQSLIEGFKMYLGTAEEKTLQFHNPPEMTPTVFETMLPYAMVLGVDKIWGQKFQNMLKTSSLGNQQYNSSWYVGASMMNMNFANTLTSSLSQSIASSSTQPSSSGSGSGGGGFSGGGGGGGGGGGW